MIGKHHAGAIFKVDLLASIVLDGSLPFEEAVDKLMHDFRDPKFNSAREDFELELKLTMGAPVTKEFPPTAVIESIKARAAGWVAFLTVQ
jgi:hypothetical protein